MAAVASHPPEEGRNLCESCGYILEGLPEEARCPECGKPVVESVGANPRRLPSWESEPSLRHFWRCSAAAMWHPGRFAKGLVTRQDTRWCWGFGVIWRGLCAVMLGLVIIKHAQWLESRSGAVWANMSPPAWLILLYVVLKISSPLWIYLLLAGVSEIAARLTAWEAHYRNIRLPLVAVRRALRYHSVHVFPVALGVLLTVWGFAWINAHPGRYPILQMITPNAFAPVGPSNYDTIYMYTLCGEVLLAAAYLFFSYWAMMRNIMFANR